MNSILFDIGATKIRMAFSVDGEIFEEPKVFETPKSYEEILKLFVATTEELAKGREIKTIAGGMSRSIPKLTEEKLRDDLDKNFGVAVFIENDAAMVGLGEANWGAGRGFEIVAYITVSTGVGGARIVNGKIDERSIGFEPGKQICNVRSIFNNVLALDAVNQNFDPFYYIHLEKLLRKEHIKGKKIFIIHGHDNEMKKEVQLLLERADLEGIVLHECPDKGRTIIQKLIEECYYLQH